MSNTTQADTMGRINNPANDFRAIRDLVNGLSTADLAALDIPGVTVMITTAYRAAAVKRADWVSIKRLRDAVNTTDLRFNVALYLLTDTQTVALAPDSNRKVLTQADFAAAVWWGDWNHLVAWQDF